MYFVTLVSDNSGINVLWYQIFSWPKNYQEMKPEPPILLIEFEIHFFWSAIRYVISPLVLEFHS